MPDEPTLSELREHAADLGIAGRSSMSRDELAAAIAAEETAGSGGDTPGVAADPVDVSLEDQSGRPPLREVAEQLAADREHQTRASGA